MNEIWQGDHLLLKTRAPVEIVSFANCYSWRRGGIFGANVKLLWRGGTGTRDKKKIVDNVEHPTSIQFRQINRSVGSCPPNLLSSSPLHPFPDMVLSLHFILRLKAYPHAYIIPFLILSYSSNLCAPRYSHKLCNFACLTRVLLCVVSRELNVVIERRSRGRRYDCMMRSSCESIRMSQHIARSGF